MLVVKITSSIYLILKRFFLCLIFLCVIVAIDAQTIYFNNAPNIDRDRAIRPYSLEIAEDHVIVTIEIEALKKFKEIKYFTSVNTYIESDNYTLCTIKGYYIKGRIEPCGINNKWLFKNVEKGEKVYYKLYFAGTIPSGVTKISIIDKGEISYSDFETYHSFSFYNREFDNPRKNYSNIDTEDLAKENIDSNNDGICGIYEQIASKTNYKLACIKENDSYKLIYLSSSEHWPWWQAGDIKASINRSASGVFKAEWYMSNKSVNPDTYLMFDGISMIVKQPTGSDPGESKYLKMYPSNSSGFSGTPDVSGIPIDKYGKVWSGTGFALKNGYIITNNHVVDGAKSITILGINGDFNTEYKGEVITIDKNNDLALIKINDSRFAGFNIIPYTVSNRICEVGEEVFVLGFPLTSYMGDEIKLTNGIISSRSGYQGDITTYQISAPLQPGNSGGPMFDSQGNVVGIVNAGIPGAENVGYAIKTSFLYNMVSSSVSTSIIPQSNRVQGTSLAEKVKSVKNCVFYIKCKGN